MSAKKSMAYNIPDAIMASPQMKRFLSGINNAQTKENNLRALSLYGICIKKE